MANYRHQEAFALMWYACKDCGHRERIWNSRDGVTPFGCPCSSCGSVMSHVAFGADVCAPHHLTYRGQRFWRNGTMAEAVKIMEIRFARHPPPPEVKERIMQDVLDGKSDEFPAGWPMLDMRPLL